MGEWSDWSACSITCGGSAFGTQFKWRIVEDNRELIDDEQMKTVDEPRDCSKYSKMLKIGLPLGAIRNAMTRDGMDPNTTMNEFVDTVGRNNLTGNVVQNRTKSAANEVLNCGNKNEDNDCTKYSRMLKIGIPLNAVENAMLRDGKDPLKLLNQNDKLVNLAT